MTMILSRRVLIGLICAGPLAGCMPESALRVAGTEARLRDGLDQVILSHSPADLHLVRFSEERIQTGQTRLMAVVRMDWPPGKRQRRFVAEGADVDTALQELLAQVERRFSAV